MVSKITGEKYLSLISIVALKRKASVSVEDSSHPLYSSFQLFPSGRRYKVPLVKKAKNKKTLVF